MVLNMRLDNRRHETIELDLLNLIRLFDISKRADLGGGAGGLRFW